MKTKISHLGRSTVSVILAVMMLLSTMLIGTVSTVNAATSTKKVFLLNAADWPTPYAYCWDGDNNNGKWPGTAMTKEGTKDGFDVYSFTPSTGYSKIIFNNNEGTQTTDIDYPTTDNQMYNNYTKQWTTYSGGSGGGSTEATYYLGGRVGQNLKSDKWLGFTKNYEFKKTETSGLYKYVSNQTPAQWTQTRGNDLKQYFFVHTGSNAKWYGSTQETGLTSANQVATLSAYSSGDDTNTARLLYINNSDTSGNVTFWFDTRNSDKQLYYTVGSESSLTPVAQSVSLKASANSVQVGTEVTLTASLNKKATGLNDADVAYEFERTNGATVTGTTTRNTYKFTPTTAGDYTFKVTASATNYTSVTNKVTVTATSDSSAETTQPVTSDYYFWYSTDSSIANSEKWQKVPMTQNGSNYSVSNLPVNTGGNFYFIVNKDAGKPYLNTVWKTQNEVSVDCTECTKLSRNDGQSYNVSGQSDTVYYHFISVKENGSYSFTFDGNKTVKVTEDGSIQPTEPTETVIKVPTVENAIVTAKSGTVTAGEGGSLTVANGSTFEVTVTPDDGYELAGIIYNNETKKASPATFTAAVTGKIRVIVNKPTEATPFKVAYGSNEDVKTIDMVATKKDGVYVSTVSLENNTNFTIYDVNNNKYALKKTGDTWYINDLDKSVEFNTSWSVTPTINNGAGGFKNNTNKAAYVVYNSKDSTVTLQAEPDFGDKAILYVKKGTSGAGATGEYASNSEAPKLRATSSGTTYKKYSVEYDTNVNIQTTMSDKYLKARYYVAGYSVNGRSYPASAVDASKGIYQTNITITEDIAENGVVEVTPIYYNRTIEENDNYITFYVDAERLVGDWGSTVAIYAYAYKGGTASYGNDHKVTNNVNLLGAYPGQPMVKDGQYYVAKIPRCNYVISSDDGSLEIDKKSTVAGITLNNYYNDAVHNSLVPIKRNMQTYDFSDFVALANKKDVKTIMFQSKFYNATGDAKENRFLIYGNSGEIKYPETAKKHIDNIESANVNPYEDFTDYYGRATDLIGNILDDTQKADKNNLYVISTGSYNSSESTSGYSTKGEWVTIWNVYDHDGKLITYGTPANFLDETTEQYQVIANTYKGKPVKISYEKGLVYGQNKDTSRTDGRWYYSTLGQEFTSDVAIEYKMNQNDEFYTADTDSNAGNNTGFVGDTTKATATINNVTTASFSSVTETAHLNIKVANGWRFDGWFIKQGDKYTEVSDNYTDISTDVLMSNSYHIVARVSKIPTGTLELNHTAYTGTDPTAHEGTGFYYISAVVKRTDNSQIKFDETQGKISIDNFAANDSLEITLRAKCHGDNTVFALYKGEAGGYTKIGPEDKDLSGESEFTYTFTVSASSLFKGNELAVNALNYYTDIVKVGGTCDITYMYKDRFGVEGEGKMVSYVVRNVELSTDEITHGYIPTDETITKYAPRIDTMYLETKWNLNDAEKVKKGESQATVIATQTKKMCKVYYPTLEGGYYTDIANSTPYEVDYNTLLMDENGNFLLSAPETDGNGSQFSYWDVYKADKNGGNTGELVTKCYEHNFGLRIMADYYIEPVYGVRAPTLTANINAPVLNREIYGDSANPKDKLYADLLTAFTSTAIPTFKENKTDLKVECGVFVVRNNTSTLSVDDRNTLVNAAATGAVDTTSDILAKYKMTSQVETSVKSQLEKLAVDSSVKNNTNNTYKFDSDDDYRVTKFVFDNKSLTNKNRIDKVLRYTNNTANQNYIFTAYAFVVIKDSNGTVKEMKISEPQYFNMCYVGNKAL